MTVVIYKSTDSSAPVMTGQVGTLIALLDACLVNGYGAKSAAGWTKSFFGTNTATYRQGTGSTGFYLHVNDNGPGVGTFKEARVFGSETASAVLIGTSLFPTVAQATNGVFIRKSSTLDATARSWIIAADQRTIHLFIQTGDAAGVYLSFHFGEFYSIKSSTDNYRAYIMARAFENAVQTTQPTEVVDEQYMFANTALSGHYIVRDDLANPGAVTMNKQGDIGAIVVAANWMPFHGGFLFYHRVDGNVIYLAPIRIIQITPTNVIRGYMRGMYHFCHPISNVNDGDTFSGQGVLNGRSFLIIKQSGNAGVFTIETSDTWDTN